MGSADGLGLKPVDLVAVYGATRAVFEEVQACESPQHYTLPSQHAGVAQWYIHVKHECGHNVVRAFCDKVKRTLDDPRAIAICGSCGVESYASDVVQSTTRIGA